jgi:hypothetical protein
MGDRLNIAGLVTGLPGLVDVCLRLGEFLSSKLKVYQTADQKIRESFLRFAVQWDNQAAVLELLRDYE